MTWPPYPLDLPVDAGRLLWEDASVFRWPFENARRVFRERFPGAPEPDWTDPRSYLSTRTGGPPPRPPGERPVARHSGYELPLDPHAFEGLEVAAPALEAGIPYQRRHVGLVEKTLANVERYAPAIFDGFRRAIRVVALKPRDAGNYDDFSDPMLPGTFIASAVRNPLDLADHFIHEFQHNRLSMIEEAGPFFEGASGDTRAYSPWRDKPRGLYGLFHGVYVFLAVGRYWRAVLEGCPAPDRAYALDRTLRIPRQLALGVEVLRRNAKLTPLGAAILDRFARDLPEVPPGDAPALVAREDGTYAPETSREHGRALSVVESVAEHHRLYG